MRPAKACESSERGGGRTSEENSFPMAGIFTESTAEAMLPGAPNPTAATDAGEDTAEAGAATALGSITGIPPTARGGAEAAAGTITGVETAAATTAATLFAGPSDGTEATGGLPAGWPSRTFATFPSAFLAPFLSSFPFGSGALTTEAGSLFHTCEAGSGTEAAVVSVEDAALVSSFLMAAAAAEENDCGRPTVELVRDKDGVTGFDGTLAKGTQNECHHLIVSVILTL